MDYELSPSRFKQAMHHMKESLAWASTYDDWVGETLETSGHVSSPHITPPQKPGLEDTARKVVQSKWFDAFQHQLLEYQSTLHQPLSVNQRLNRLLSILMHSFQPNALILTPVMASCEQPISWLLRHDTKGLIRLDDYTTDSTLHLALGEGKRYLTSLPLKEAGHALLQWSFPHESKGLDSIKQNMVKLYWLPLLYAALADDRLRTQVNRHQVLYQVARMANTITDKEELLDEYLRFMASYLGAAHVAALFPATDEEHPPVMWEWMHFQFKEGTYVEPPRFAGNDATPVPQDVLEFMQQRVFFNPGIRQFTEQSELHYLIHAHLPEGTCINSVNPRQFYTVAPFEMANQQGNVSPPAFGLIFVHDQPWNQAQQSLLAEANQWIWQTFQRSRNHDRIVRLSNYDELTGLMNRRAMQSRFIMEAERAVRNGQPFSLAVLDIDFFKEFNDHYGHLVGDNALRLLAEHLATHVRRADVVCRFGGEEFVLLLPETCEEEAWELVDRLRNNVASTLRIPVDIKNKRLLQPVTFSAGVFQVNLSQIEGSLLGVLNTQEWNLVLNEALTKADEALYTAKRKGRNQVLRAQDNPASNQKNNFPNLSES